MILASLTILAIIWIPGLDNHTYPKKYTDLIGSSHFNLAIIYGLSISKCSLMGLMVDLNMDTSFVGIDTLREGIFTFRLWKDFQSDKKGEKRAGRNRLHY